MFGGCVGYGFMFIYIRWWLLLLVIFVFGFLLVGQKMLLFMYLKLVEGSMQFRCMVLDFGLKLLVVWNGVFLCLMFLVVQVRLVCLLLMLCGVGQCSMCVFLISLMIVLWWLLLLIGLLFRLLRIMKCVFCVRLLYWFLLLYSYGFLFLDRYFCYRCSLLWLCVVLCFFGLLNIGGVGCEISVWIMLFGVFIGMF